VQKGKRGDAARALEQVRVLRVRPPGAEEVAVMRYRGGADWSACPCPVLLLKLTSPTTQSASTVCGWHGARRDSPWRGRYGAPSVPACSCCCIVERSYDQ
jgi:hypothetical protein